MPASVIITFMFLIVPIALTILVLSEEHTLTDRNKKRAEYKELQQQADAWKGSKSIRVGVPKDINTDYLARVKAEKKEVYRRAKEMLREWEDQFAHEVGADAIYRMIIKEVERQRQREAKLYLHQGPSRVYNFKTETRLRETMPYVWKEVQAKVERFCAESQTYNEAITVYIHEYNDRMQLPLHTPVQLPDGTVEYPMKTRVRAIAPAREVEQNYATIRDLLNAVDKPPVHGVQSKKRKGAHESVSAADDGQVLLGVQAQ